MQGFVLQNHFVTPFTSLVVVQPDKENCKDYEEDDADEEEESIDTTRHKQSSGYTDNYTTFLNSQDSVHQRFNPASIQVRLHIF